MARRAHRGFTLIEMLVVITIIAMLMGLVTAAVVQARLASLRLACNNNMREYSLAVLQFEAAKQKMPGWRNRMPTSNGRAYAVGLTPILLPYLSRNDLYKSFQTGSIPLAQLDVVMCPGDTTPSMSGRTKIGLSYVGNGGRWDQGSKTPSGAPAPLQSPPGAPDPIWNGVIFDQFEVGTTYNKKAIVISLSDINRKDGSATTMLLSENTNAGAWNYLNLTGNNVPPSAKEEALNCLVWDPSRPTGVGINRFPSFDLPSFSSGVPIDPSGDIANWDVEVYARPASYHPGGVNVAYCDGHIQFVSDSVDPNVYALICTPDGRSAGQTMLLDPALLEQ